jgi:hypothetical protein
VRSRFKKTCAPRVIADSFAAYVAWVEVDLGIVVRAHLRAALLIRLLPMWHGPTSISVFYKRRLYCCTEERSNGADSFFNRTCVRACS